MDQTPPETDPYVAQRVKNYLGIAEKVRTGEYFREARSMYDLGVHDPMAERYIYVFVTFIAFTILVISLLGVQSLYPLNTEVQLIVSTRDPYEDLPHIQSLQISKNEDPSEALLRFLTKHYVVVREEYDIQTFDRDVNGVKSQSSDAVTKEFQQFIDPRNPESPITQYQRHSRRRITILSTRRLPPDSMEVLFEATVDSKNDIKKSHWRANLSFQYSGVELDEKTGKVKPFAFVVTSYHSKRLQDVMQE